MARPWLGTATHRGGLVAAVTPPCVHSLLLPTDEAADDYEYYDDNTQAEEDLFHQTQISEDPDWFEEFFGYSDTQQGAPGWAGRQGWVKSQPCAHRVRQASAASLLVKRLHQRDELGGLFAVFSFVFLL